MMTFYRLIPRILTILLVAFLICGFMVAPAAAYNTTHVVVHCNVDGAHVHAEATSLVNGKTYTADADVVNGIAELSIRCEHSLSNMFLYPDIHLTVTADGYKTVKKDVEGGKGTKHVTINLEKVDNKKVSVHAV